MKSTTRLWQGQIALIFFYVGYRAAWTFLHLRENPSFFTAGEPTVFGAVVEVLAFLSLLRIFFRGLRIIFRDQDILLRIGAALTIVFSILLCFSQVSRYLNGIIAGGSSNLQSNLQLSVTKLQSRFLDAAKPTPSQSPSAP